jgi:N-acyl-D-amino-acid deacylase
MPDGNTARTVIRGGQVLDGTGAAARSADVLVFGDRIAAVGAVHAQPADQVIDAQGLVVAPGFINLHGHSDFTAISYPDALNRLYDGVTTEISGNCGESAFPLRGAAPDLILPDVERERVTLDWTDFAGYAARVEAARPAINHGTLVGHGALRAAAMGLDDRAPTPDEAAAMRDLLREALDQGALGLSTGLIYSPGCYATVDELADLATVCAQADPPAIYASHQRNEGDRIESSLAEFLEVARRSKAHGQLSHVKLMRPKNWAKLPWLRDQLFGARDAGLSVTGDQYPYTASSTGLSRDLPTWLHAGGRAEFLKRLADPTVRRRVAEEMHIDDPADFWGRIAVVWSPAAAHAPFLGRRIFEIAAELHRDPLELVFDLLLEAEGQITAIFHRMDEGVLREIIRWPFIVIGSDSTMRSDAGQTHRGLPHPRGYGTHSRVLGRYVREEGVLAWPEAVRKMTSAPADILGLRDRGRLVPGAFADVTIFDPGRVIDRATFGAPRQASVGIVHVLVNGVPVLRSGRPTDARPGRVLCRAR